MAHSRRCRIGHRGVGGLVQYQAAAYCHRRRSACRARSRPLRSNPARSGGWTQKLKPPRNPGRFTINSRPYPAIPAFEGVCDKGTRLTPRDAPPGDPGNIPAGAPCMPIGVSELWRAAPINQTCARRGLCRHARVGVQNWAGQRAVIQGSRLVGCIAVPVWRGQTVGPAACLYIATQVENSLICRRQGLPDCHGAGPSVRKRTPHGLRPPGGETDRRSRRRGNPATTVRMPPVSSIWVPGRRWAPGPDHPAGPNPAGGPTRERRGGAGRRGPGRQGAGGCGCPECPRPYSGVTLSDEEGSRRTRAVPPICVALGVLELVVP
jgi:hypothetical protein